MKLSKTIFCVRTLLLVFCIGTTAAFAANCWLIDWPQCSEFGGAWYGCDDICTDMFGCGDGYYSFEIPDPICSDWGYWYVFEEELPVPCGEKWTCTENFLVECPEDHRENECKVDQFHSYIITVGFYGDGDTCGME